ncbi:MAG: DUF21 domain-containing protein [Anaerolineaceae bacterium]|nr:DUF21 domain-containing protein [Anaerolineaceae bacterium]
MELLIIVLLTVVNGLLSMSEIAIVSSRKVRLEQMALSGMAGAGQALNLAQSPNRFLSTVQIGITLVGVLQGAFAGAALAHPVATALSHIEFLRPISEALGLFVVVALTTYLSLVIGELVPKRLGMQNPERIAALVAPIMHRLSQISAPIVHLLSVSTDGLLRLIGTRGSTEPPVTDEEIYSLIDQGVQAGIFEANERSLVASVMSLDDHRIESLMTPRLDIEWIDINEPDEAAMKMIAASKHSRFPVAVGSLDRVIGIVRSKDLLDMLIKGDPVSLKACIREPLFVPETSTAAHALTLFKQSGKHMALVISEFGGVEGIVTLNNLVDQIIGMTDKPGATLREDGSWLLDGLLPVDEFKTILAVKHLADEEEGHFQTLGGFVMTQLGRIPNAADHFESDGLRFEVVDMDGRRVDKVLVARLSNASEMPNTGTR